MSNEQKMEPWAVMSPNGLEFIGLCTDEAHAWCIVLGWPSEGEVAQLKKQGWWASDATLTLNRRAPTGATHD